MREMLFSDCRDGGFYVSFKFLGGDCERVAVERLDELDGSHLQKC